MFNILPVSDKVWDLLYCIFGDLQIRNFDFKLFTQFTYKNTAILELITEWGSAKPLLFT